MLRIGWTRLKSVPPNTLIRCKRIKIVTSCWLSFVITLTMHGNTKVKFICCFVWFIFIEKGCVDNFSKDAKHKYFTKICPVRAMPFYADRRMWQSKRSVLETEQLFPHATLKVFCILETNSILCEVGTESIKKKKKPYLLPLFTSFLPWRSLAIRSFPPTSHIHICLRTNGTRGVAVVCHCATGQKDKALLPDVFNGIFYWLSPSGRTLLLGRLRL